MLVPLSPPPGLNSDDTTFGAEGAWADGDNCRFDGGRPQALGGALTQFTIAGDQPILDIFAFSRSGTATVAYGRGNGSFFVGSGISAPSDRSPASPPSGTNGWSFAAWGNTLLAAFVDGTLYEQSGSGAATEVTQAPDRIDAGILVTPERQLLAFGCNEEGGAHNPLCIRGCDLEDYTDWTSSATNNAFEHILEGGGKIVCARMIGSYVAVWTDEGLYLGQFVGDPSQTYRFDRVDVGCGLIARRAVETMGQTAYWLGPDLRVRQWAPGSLPTVIPCPIGQDFRGNADNFSPALLNTFAVALHSRQEVWFFYADLRDVASYPSRYIAYSLLETAMFQRPVWFKGTLARTAMLESGLLFDAADGMAPLSGNSVGVVRLEDIDGQGDAPAGYIQSADQYLDNSQRRIMVRGIRPDFERQTVSVSLTLFVRDNPMSSATTKGPHTITTSTTKKDFRASGKLIAAKFSWASTSGVRVRLGKLLFDIVPLGER